MVGLVKLIAERSYGDIKDITPDVRVFHSEPEYADRIADWYQERGWEVTKEPI